MDENKLPLGKVSCPRTFVLKRTMFPMNHVPSGVRV